jgi:uncharacterized membrane protein
MSNNNSTLKMLVFIALAAFLVGAVAATVVASASQADAQAQTTAVCPKRSPSPGKPVWDEPRGCSGR